MHFQVLRFLFLVTALAALLPADETPPFYFSTLAGQASRGSADGTGPAARFCAPNGATVDAAGNLYVADSFNHTIRRITPAGVVTTVAGTASESDFADGTGPAARFNWPNGVAVDAAGNIFVADRDNHVIRKISPAGVVTTLAGSPGVTGSIDGTGAAARFNRPNGLAVDSAGNIFVVELQNHLVRRITPDGVVSTLAGKPETPGYADGLGEAARFQYPTGIAVDAAGNVYVADHNNVCVRKITPAGAVTTLAGKPGVMGSADGIGTAATFGFPRDVAVDAAGNVLVADVFNFTLRQISPAGVVTTLAGKAGELGRADGTGANARFGYLTGVTVDQAGNVYLVDLWHNSVRKVTPAGVVTTLAGNGDSIGSADGPAASARFYRPSGVAVDGAGNVYVADRLNSTIRKITAAGVVSTLAGAAGSAGSVDGTGDAARFEAPQAVAVDSAGNVYVTEPTRNVIRKITPGGAVTTFAGANGARGSTDGTGSAARFDSPSGIAIDSADNLYVADRNNGTIRKVSPGGVVTTLAGSPLGAFGYADGTGSAAKFAGPEGIAVDQAGNVYVAEFYNHTIRRITPGGAVTTLAGLAQAAGTVDGTGSAARFDHPSHVAVDTAGNVYVTDTLNHTFRRVTPAGVVTTLAGSAGEFPSSEDGVGSTVRFFSPSGVALTGTGFAYVVDAENNTIRQGQLAKAPVAVTQPQSLTVAAGASVQFSMTAAAVPAPSYQWYHNGAPFSGATSSTLSFANARSSDAGDYTVVATNPLGSVTSARATLAVTAAPSSPPPASAGGGGGAPSSWFVLALLALGAGRAGRRLRNN